MPEPSLPDTSATVLVVGIDEAGYGPVLGPLVVSAAAIEVPVTLFHRVADPAAGPDFWGLLQDGIVRDPRRRDRRLIVADSKKLHGRPAGGHPLLLLERAALTFVGLSGQEAGDLRALLAAVHPGSLPTLATYPWYAPLEVTLPVAADPLDIATQRNALAGCLRSAGLRFAGLWSEVLPEGHFNDMVKATRNKAVVAFGLVTRLIQRIADHVGPMPMSIWIDRQGGRTGYRQPLMRAFEPGAFEVIEESAERSGYRLTVGRCRWVIRFLREGEQGQMPIALASILSKYLRELLMICFNRFWSAQVPGLRPTAGYYEDGRRFLADIRPAIDRLRIPEHRLVRML